SRGLRPPLPELRLLRSFRNDVVEWQWWLHRRKGTRMFLSRANASNRSSACRTPLVGLGVVLPSGADQKHQHFQEHPHKPFAVWPDWARAFEPAIASRNSSMSRILA